MDAVLHKRPFDLGSQARLKYYPSWKRASTKALLSEILNLTAHLLRRFREGLY
jgi:hypothetical protein